MVEAKLKMDVGRTRQPGLVNPDQSVVKKSFPSLWQKSMLSSREISMAKSRS
jgi:hypothetical protein